MLYHCPLAVIPVRKEPSDKSEQVNQLLFGENISVLEAQAKWSLIRSQEGYEGWVDNKQIQQGEIKHEWLVVEPFIHFDQGGNIMLLPFGSRVPKNTDGATPYLTASPTSLVDIGMKYLNSPYLWGGRTLMGIDCSGFVQQVFGFHGLQLARDAWQQAEIGQTLLLPSEAHAGDLAFFDNAEGRIIHVGLLIDDRHILHASGQVRIDLLDQEGIFNRELGRYTHKLRLLKRVI